MSELSYIKVFLDWTEATRKLADHEKGRLIDAMVAYAKGEDVDARLAGNEAFVFPMFQLQLDRDRQEYAEKIRKQRENGLKGGRPKKADDKNENPKNPPVSAKTQKSQDKDKDKDKDYTPSSPKGECSPAGSKSIKFADFVRMTQKEYDSLVAKHGETTTNELISILDNYKGSTGKKYRSDYRAILSWVEDKWRETQAKGKKTQMQTAANYSHTVSTDDMDFLLRETERVKKQGFV